MIYLDNASTSFPKAPGVSRRVMEAIDTGCFNVGRGSYAGAWAMEELVFETRERLAGLFGCPDSRGVIFTSGVTLSLNMLLRGLLRPGDRAVTTAMDHNAVLRPLRQLEQSGVAVEVARCDEFGLLDLCDLREKLRPGARAVVMTHASNVCGTLQPVAEVGRLCRERGALFIVDAAQTAGALPLDMCRDGIDALAFTGHKGLLATQGIGGFLLREGLSRQLAPLLSGGTGSFSDSLEVPLPLPDRFEAGTLNLPGIVALSAALDYLGQRGIDAVAAHEDALRQAFVERLNALPGVRLVGPREPGRCCAVAALDFPGRDNGEIAHLLDERYRIMTRSGLHCAPLAHRALGTFPRGVVRFSFGHANTLEEVELCAGALEEILSDG